METRNWSRKFALTLVLFLGMTNLAQPQQMENFWWEKVNGEDMNQEKWTELIKTDKLIVLDIYARGCYYCFRLMDVWNEARAQWLKKNTNVVFAKLDGPANGSLMENFYVDGFPTLMLFRRSDRNVPVRFGGPRTIEHMSVWISSFIKDDDFISGKIGKAEFLGLPANAATPNVANDGSDPPKSAEEKASTKGIVSGLKKVDQRLARAQKKMQKEKIASRTVKQILKKLKYDLKRGKGKPLDVEKFLGGEKSKLKGVILALIKKIASDHKPNGKNEASEGAAKMINTQYENWDTRFDSFEMKIEGMFKKLTGETEQIEKSLEDSKSLVAESGPGGHHHHKHAGFAAKFFEIALCFMVGGLVAACYFKAKAYDKVM